MCGIAGYGFVNGPPPNREVLKAMGQALIHRGPDDEGMYLDDEIGLIHRRLSIIDLEMGSNPVFNETRSILTIFNGEIYNFRELRKQLEGRGHRFSTNSDTEVLVHLYEEYGDNLVIHLNGMFAFALYDKAKRKLILARDRIGKKPLYYYFNGSCLAFASEIQALRHVPGVKLELDLASVGYYFRYQYVPTPHSIYKQIKKLEAATCLIYQKGKVTTHRYWDLPSQNVMEPPETPEVLRERFLELLTDAVRCRMIADVPLGGFLSGGLDSTAIVYLMAQSVRTPIKTFTIGFESASFDESSIAAEVAGSQGTDHSVYMMDQLPLHDLPKILSHFGEPFADGSAVPTYYLCKAAREHVKVALSGDGCDEVLGGYNRYVAGSLARFYFKMPSALRPSRLDQLVGWLPESKDYYGHSRIKQLKYLARFIDNLQDNNQLPSPRLFTDKELSPLMELPLRFDEDDPVSTRDRMENDLPFPARMLWADCRSYLPDDIFVKIDRMSMAHALEVRSPFVDYRLIEFLASVPMQLKTQHGKTKILLKTVMSNIFPRVTRRAKHGFEAPIAQWLSGPLYEPFMDLVHSDCSNLLNRKYVLELMNRHVKTRQDLSKQLWAIYVFLNWVKTLRYQTS